MAFDMGFNFRSTENYVTDGTNEVFVPDNKVYPVSAKGFTFGHSSTGSLQSRDRSTSIDRRLAGSQFVTSGSSNFRIDLPEAGPVLVNFAGGDTGGTYAAYTLTIQDGNSTVLISLPAQSVSSGNHIDPYGSIFLDARWPGGEQAYYCVPTDQRLILVFDTTNAHGHIRVRSAPKGFDFRKNAPTYRKTGGGAAATTWGGFLSDQWNRIVQG